MKMRKDRYETIKRIVSAFVDRIGRDNIAEHAGNVNSKRFRWDMFWCGCRAYPGGLGFDLYADGVNDTHVDTVLRNVMVELNIG
jgi:hypothetical protein